MKQIQSKSYNITDDIIGKVTFGKNPFSRSNCILVGKGLTKSRYGYMATITDHMIEGEGKPYSETSQIEEFKEGDVVLISKTGLITFLYEIASGYNAIMATGRCNHRCIMCPQPPILQEADKTAENLRLISLFDKGTKDIGITGGEPTLIGDHLFELINQIKKKLPKASVSLLSNGVKFADESYAAKLALCDHHDLQIDIPIFSDIASEHNRIVGASTFYKTVNGLYNLAKYKQKIGLRIVIHKQTYRRLTKLADFIYHNFPFVNQVAFMQMETTGLAKENIDDLWIDPYDYNNELKEAVLLLNDRGMNVFVYNAQLCVLPIEIREFAVQSISDWKDNFVEECEGCRLKSRCAGFFTSNLNYRSAHIHKINC